MSNGNAHLEQVEKQIEVSIEAAKEAVKKKEAITRLFENPDFKLIFEKGYFEENAARLVGLLNDPEFASEEKKQELMNDMMGISATKQYLLSTYRIGEQMEMSIKASEEELEALRNEESGEE